MATDDPKTVERRRRIIAGLKHLGVDPNQLVDKSDDELEEMHSAVLRQMMRPGRTR